MLRSCNAGRIWRTGTFWNLTSHWMFSYRLTCFQWKLWATIGISRNWCDSSHEGACEKVFRDSFQVYSWRLFDTQKRHFQGPILEQCAIITLVPRSQTDTQTPSPLFIFISFCHRSTYLSGGISYQTRQTSPLHLWKFCFDMTATPSCYCRERTRQVSNDVETSATRLFLHPHWVFLILKLFIFLFCLSPPTWLPPLIPPTW